MAGDTNGVDDVFITRFRNGTTTLVSTGTGGAPADGASVESQVSRNGRYITFNSRATNLVSGDTNGKLDVFVWDRITGTMLRASTSFDECSSRTATVPFLGSPPTGGTSCIGPTRATSCPVTRTVRGTFSASTAWLGPRASEPWGRRVELNASSVYGSSDDSGNLIAFNTSASNAVTGDTNGMSDVFVRNVTTGVTSRIVSGTGEANGGSANGVLAPDGGFVIFRSGATNLVASDSNGEDDLFLGAVP